jgi:DNA-binding MarR family transcriptional regulator
MPVRENDIQRYAGELALKKLSGAQLQVALLILSLCKVTTDGYWTDPISQTEIATIIEVDRTTVSVSLRKLIGLNLIRSEVVGNRANKYGLIIEGGGPVIRRRKSRRMPKLKA